MDSAQKTLIEIASVSQRVVNTLDRYVGRNTVENLWLDKIVVGSRTVLEALNKTLLLKDGNADDRLVDWLNSDEPKACLRTLNQMEEILDRKVEYGVKSLFKASRSTHSQDNFGEAIRLFRMRKGYFHFLLTTDVWNRESGVQQQPRLTAQPDVTYTNQAVDVRGLATDTRSKSGGASGVIQARKIRTMGGQERINLTQLDGILGWLNAWNSRGTHEPGAGKSVLAASVIEGLKNTLQDGEDLAYFYCDFREERSTSAAEVLRSLLMQLLQQFRCHAVDPGDLLDELVEERDGGASTISNVTLLARHVSRAAKQFHEPPFLIIDALDECKDVEELLGALVKLQKGSVRILAISRPLQIIKDSFSDLPFIDLEAMSYEISADIRLHVTRELDSHRRLRIVDASLKDEIYSALRKKAGGMFRWVQCQLNILKQCVTASELREALNDLPSDLNGTYGRILAEIDRTKREGKVARRALDWLVVAITPLQLSQIMEGLSIDLPRRALDRDSAPVHGPALLDALGSLVTYDQVTDIVILSHFSVKEYLIAESTRSEYPAYHVDQQAAHTQLALLCLSYIGIYLRRLQKSGGYEASSSETYTLRMRHDNPNTTASHSKKRPGPSLQFFESHPLLQYVLSSGFYHLHHVNPRNRTILCAIKFLQLDAQQHPSEWRLLCDRATAISSYFSYLTSEHDVVLYILIAFAPEPLLRSFIGRTKLQPRDGTNPLIYAVFFDQIEHARTLLSQGANPNLRGLNVAGSSRLLPLELAVRRNHSAMVNLFLGEGSHVPHGLFVDGLVQGARSRNRACIISRLLQTEEFVEWAADVQDDLLLRGLNHTRYHFGDEPSEQDIDIIQRRLVQIGCDPPARFDEASLRYAVSAGHVSTIKHMLSQNIAFPSDIILDASQSRNSKSTIIRIFLDMGYEVDVTSPIGDTPLHFVLQYCFSEDDCLESVQILIDAGCNPSSCNLRGKTPLHLAARCGYVSVAEYLLSLQVPMPPDIMFVASRAAMFRSLTNQGADVHAIAADGSTPLHFVLGEFWPWVNSDESLECVEILIGAGCNPSLPNAYGKTAFAVAAEHDRLPVVQYLLSIRVPLPPSVLLSVVGNHRSTTTSIIKLFIDNGADLHATRLNGDTLLHLAMRIEPEVECLMIIKILVNAGCNPRACNLRGRTSFHFAARERYVLVMEYLLSIGIPVPSDVMLTQLEWVTPSQRRWYSATRFLLDKGGDIHTISGAGDTLLHFAASLEPEHDAVEFATFLAHAGCSPSTPNSRHETPLHIAAQNGNISILDYFLSLGISLPPDILLAASTGPSEKTQVIRYLVEKGVDVSVVTTNGDGPLHLLLVEGTQYDRLESVKTLIDAGCDPRAQNATKETPMHNAARRGSISILGHLLSQGVPLPEDILLTSAPSTIRFLFGKGVDIRCVAANVDMQVMDRVLDFPDDSEEDYLECAKILVDAGWNASLRNSAGETPIHIAARHGRISTIQYLLSHGIPLPSDVLLAVSGTRYLHLPLVRFLVREGAFVNAAAPNGDTPLHLALSYKSSHDGDNPPWIKWELVEILLTYGADPSARNADGQTPFDIAEANGHFFNGNFLRLVQNAHRIRFNS